MTLAVRTSSPEETEAVGFAVGRAAVPGLVVALQGPLGAGKTVLTKGIARGLGVPAPQYVCSPTFTIHRQYEGRLALHHLDLYRLTAEAELEDLGLEDALGGSGVCVIEWPDSFFRALPQDRITVRFVLISPQERVLEFEASGGRSAALWGDLREALRLGSAREESA